jgi:hypothetical protein
MKSELLILILKNMNFFFIIPILIVKANIKEAIQKNDYRTLPLIIH